MEHQGLEQVMIALNQYGFGPQLSMKIYQVYKEMTIDIIQSNPYKLSGGCRRDWIWPC